MEKYTTESGEQGVEVGVHPVEPEPEGKSKYTDYVSLMGEDGTSSPSRKKQRFEKS